MELIELFAVITKLVSCFPESFYAMEKNVIKCLIHLKGPAGPQGERGEAGPAGETVSDFKND